MTKQEEIDRDIEFTLTATYHAGKTGEPISETIDKCKLYLKKQLHSKGCVIKVDAEEDLFAMLMNTTYTENDIERSDIGTFVLTEKTVRNIIKTNKDAGYTAVEPLIEKVPT